MGIDTISAYAVGIFVMVIIINSMLKSVKRITIILINTLFGGALFLILNILGMKLSINVISVGMVGLLGIPGVVIAIIMKFILGVY